MIFDEKVQEHFLNHVAAGLYFGANEEREDEIEAEDLLDAIEERGDYDEDLRKELVEIYIPRAKHLIELFDLRLDVAPSVHGHRLIRVVGGWL